MTDLSRRAVCALPVLAPVLAGTVTAAPLPPPSVQEREIVRRMAQAGSRVFAPAAPERSLIDRMIRRGWMEPAGDSGAAVLSSEGRIQGYLLDMPPAARVDLEPFIRRALEDSRDGIGPDVLISASSHGPTVSTATLWRDHCAGVVRPQIMRGQGDLGYLYSWTYSDRITQGLTYGG